MLINKKFCRKRTYQQEENGRGNDYLSLFIRGYFITTVQKVPISAIQATGKYIGSTVSYKYHNPGCRYAEKIASENQIWFKDSTDAQTHGYEPCGVCKP